MIYFIRKLKAINPKLIELSIMISSELF